MCPNYISGSEQLVAEAALAIALLRQPAQEALAAAGVLTPYDPVRRDARTVGFLRTLDLDPVEILGSDTVDQADRWTPKPQVQPWRWLRPITPRRVVTAGS